MIMVLFRGVGIVSALAQSNSTRILTGGNMTNWTGSNITNTKPTGSSPLGMSQGLSGPFLTFNVLLQLMILLYSDDIDLLACNNIEV